jgi:2-polyprenyl-6-methoxyphenol hydroxylase-like FAD-dependent oxidoreductase
MGIHDAVIAASTDMQGVLLVDRDGKFINKMSGDAFGHRERDDVEIVRGTLCQILMDHTSDAEFILGDSIQAISQYSDSVLVEFTKNCPRKFDLVIGADGLHSNVRGIVFGDESRFVRDLGLYLCVYTVPNYLNLDHRHQLVLGSCPDQTARRNSQRLPPWKCNAPSWGEWPRSGVLGLMPMPKHVLALLHRLSILICETELSSSRCSQKFMRASVGKFPDCWR